MNEECKTILDVLTKYLTANPDIRFCQALVDLNINQIDRSPVISGGMIRTNEIKDNYYDTNHQVLDRLNGQELVKLL